MDGRTDGWMDGWMDGWQVLFYSQVVVFLAVLMGQCVYDNVRIAKNNN